MVLQFVFWCQIPDLGQWHKLQMVFFLYFLILKIIKFWTKEKLFKNYSPSSKISLGLTVCPSVGIQRWVGPCPCRAQSYMETCRHMNTMCSVLPWGLQWMFRYEGACGREDVQRVFMQAEAFELHLKMWVRFSRQDREEWSMTSGPGKFWELWVPTVRLE